MDNLPIRSRKRVFPDYQQCSCRVKRGHTADPSASSLDLIHPPLRSWYIILQCRRLGNRYSNLVEALLRRGLCSLLDPLEWVVWLLEKKNLRGMVSILLMIRPLIISSCLRWSMEGRNVPTSSSADLSAKTRSPTSGSVDESLIRSEVTRFQMYDW